MFFSLSSPIVMFTCNKGGWEWEGPEEGGAPGKIQTGVQSWRPECAALEASIEINGSI
jgi:hypothetical protein